MASTARHYILRPVSRVRSVGRGLALAGLALGAALAASCNQTPFTTRDPRTQYDRYDAVRNQLPPAYTYDEFGRQRPNLRGRLTPRQ